MYNRYIPQPDGTFRRDTVRPKEPSSPPRQMPRKPAPAEPPCPPSPAPPPPPCQSFAGKPHRPGAGHENQSIPEFLRQLLPGGLDTGDLLVIVLLLLMAGDVREDRNHALLTLVLYLFL